jgi:hypothetical protein
MMQQFNTRIFDSLIEKTEGNLKKKKPLKESIQTEKGHSADS